MVCICYIFVPEFLRCSCHFFKCIFAVGAFRLLPALRESLSAWTQIQNSVFCLRIIKAGMEDLFSTFEEKPTAGLSFEKEIAISNLSYTYPEGKRVLKEFDCTIRKGEYIGIRGSSGIGKSTLFNLLLGFLKPDGGEIRIDGVLLSAENRKLWHRRIGYVPQGVFILDGTLAENVALGCCDISKEKVKRILRQVRLDEWVDELPLGIDTLLGESGARLSGGQKQRVGIARALYKEADIDATGTFENGKLNLDLNIDNVSLLGNPVSYTVEVTYEGTKAAN